MLSLFSSKISSAIISDVLDSPLDLHISVSEGVLDANSCSLTYEVVASCSFSRGLDSRVTCGGSGIFFIR